MSETKPQNTSPFINRDDVDGPPTYEEEDSVSAMIDRRREYRRRKKQWNPCCRFPAAQIFPRHRGQGATVNVTRSKARSIEPLYTQSWGVLPVPPISADFQKILGEVWTRWLQDEYCTFMVAEVVPPEVLTTRPYSS